MLCLLPLLAPLIVPFSLSQRSLRSSVPPRVSPAAALLRSLTAPPGSALSAGWQPADVRLASLLLQDLAVSVSAAAADAYLAWCRAERIPPPEADGDAAPASSASGPSAAVSADPSPADPPSLTLGIGFGLGPPPALALPSPNLSPSATSAPRAVSVPAARSLLLPSLASTRALERFRNELSLRLSLEHLHGSVVDMLEDRQQLWRAAPGAALVRWWLPLDRRGELDALVGLRRQIRRAGRR